MAVTVVDLPRLGLRQDLVRLDYLAEALLDEARKLVRGRADRAERLLVVHPHRAEQRDRAERAVGQAVRGAQQRELAQRRVLELDPDANEGPAWVQSLAEHLQKRRPLL